MAGKIPDSTATRIFRSPRSLIIVTAIAMLMFIAAAIGTYMTDGGTVWVVGGIGMSVFGVVAFIDVLLTRMVLSAEELEIYSNFRRRKYPRSAFVNVTWAKGCPISLQFREGGWLRLPTVGTGSAQGMVNTLRAWIKR